MKKILLGFLIMGGVSFAGSYTVTNIYGQTETYNDPTHSNMYTTHYTKKYVKMSDNIHYTTQYETNYKSNNVIYVSTVDFEKKDNTIDNVLNGVSEFFVSSTNKVKSFFN